MVIQNNPKVESIVLWSNINLFHQNLPATFWAVLPTVSQKTWRSEGWLVPKMWAASSEIQTDQRWNRSINRSINQPQGEPISPPAGLTCSACWTMGVSPHRNINTLHVSTLITCHCISRLRAPRVAQGVSQEGCCLPPPPQSHAGRRNCPSFHI